MTETVLKRLEYWGKVVCICSENNVEIFEGGGGLSRNSGRIQSIFNEKPQSSTTVDLSWLLIQIVTWWVILDRLALVVSGLI